LEFGKQFYYQADETINFEIKPQPSFNKDFNLLIHNFKENEKAGLENIIFTDSTKQIERLYSIFEDLNAGVKFSPVYLSLREGFIDHSQKLVCY
jgi:transcription-repair coupling factor (superfamily II helicase)